MRKTMTPQSVQLLVLFYEITSKAEYPLECGIRIDVLHHMSGLPQTEVNELLQNLATDGYVDYKNGNSIVITRKGLSTGSSYHKYTAQAGKSL